MRRRSHLSSPVGIAHKATFGLGLVAVAATMLLFALLPGDGFAMKGSFYKGQLTAEQKKCKSKKGKARLACRKAVKGKAARSTRNAMRGVKGLYGHNLKSSQIPARNGTLIWSKDLGPTPGAARTAFVLYSSKSSPRNRKIVVSGTVSTPKGKPPAGGWPVISWAHGTTGLADQCAPSRGGDQGSYGGAEPLIQGWLDDGYAVVATDYEGLGTRGIHPYLQGESEGRGTLDIVRASRSLDSKLSKKVIIAGHSQGGHAALFAAKLAPQWSKDFNHVGTIPYAPPADFQLQGAGIGALPSDAYGISALATAILRGAATSDSSIDAQKILTPEAYALYPKVESACLDELTESFADAEVGPGELLRPGILFQPDGAAFTTVLGEMDPLVKTNRPLLILQGRQDTTVQPGLTDTLVSRLRGLNPGLAIDYFVYGNAGIFDIPTSGASTHSSILADAEAQVDEFIAESFGLPAN